MYVSDAVFGGALAFLFGVLAASLGWSAVIYLPVAAIAGFGYLFLSRRPELKKFFLLFLILIFSGAFYYNFYLNLKAKLQSMEFNRKISFSGVIVDEPTILEKYSMFTIKLRAPFSGKIRVFTDPSGRFQYGDLLQVEGEIMPADLPNEMPAVFSPKIVISARHQGFWLKEKLLDVKTRLIGSFAGLFSADEAALLGGITFGSRSNFGGEFKKQMALSGTTHLVALSGYNISILVLAVAQAFGRFLSRRKTFYLTTVIILLFVLMVGAEASVVRAAVMGFLALLAKEIGRVYSMRNSITLTALGMVLISPTILVNSPGFQLSFVSLLGIVYLGPALKNMFKFKDAGFADWRENAVTTISAQLAVMPILIQNFGQYSLMAIFANILILAFIPLTMALGFLLSALGLLSFYIGFFVAQLVKVLLLYEISVIKLFAKIPFSLPLGNSAVVMIIYYAIVFFVVYNFYLRIRHEKAR